MQPTDSATVTRSPQKRRASELHDLVVTVATEHRHEISGQSSGVQVDEVSTARVFKKARTDGVRIYINLTEISE